MIVVLIEPPDSPPAVREKSGAERHSRSVAPPLAMLCVQAYLRQHTRHFCHVLDCRIYSDVERDLPAALGAIENPSVVVVNTRTLGLGETAAVLDIVKRRLPRAVTAICGPFPSRFPQHAAVLTQADYALAGDPEPILRNLLDYADVPQRLRRIPGLLARGQPEVVPYWLPDLKSLSLPDWNSFFWGAYQSGLTHQPLQAEMRLSRGHTHTPADRAFGGGGRRAVPALAARAGGGVPFEVRPTGRV